MAGFDVLGYLNDIGAGRLMPGRSNESIATTRRPAAPKQSPLTNTARSAGNFVKSTAGAVVKSATDTATGLYRNTTGNLAQRGGVMNINARNRQLEAKQNEIISAYKNKKISKQQYSEQLRALLNEGTKVAADANRVSKMKTAGYGEVAGNVAGVGATALTLAAPAVGTAAKAFGVVAGAGRAGKTVTALNRGVAGGVGVGKALTGVTQNNVVRTLTAAPGKLVRNTLAIQPTVQAGIDVGSGIKERDAGKVALNSAILASPLGFGAAAKYAPRLGKATSEAFYGRESFFNAVKAAGGPDYLKALKEARTPQQKAKVEGRLRQLQQVNLDASNGDVKAAAARVVQNLREDFGDDLSKINTNAAVKHADEWMKAESSITKAAKEGRIVGDDGKVITLKPGQSYVAARANPKEINTLRQAWEKASTADERVAILKGMSEAGASISKNSHLMARLGQAALKDDWRKDIAPNRLPQLHRFQITGKDTAVNVDNFMDAKGTTKAPRLPQGYGVGVVDFKRPEIKAVKDTDAIDQGKAANAVLGKIGKLLTKGGVSTEGMDRTSFMKFRANFNGNVKNIEGNVLSGNEILNRLGKYGNTGRATIGLSDERQLMVGEIQRELQVDRDTAKAIKAALFKSYDNMSVKELGLAGKVQNAYLKLPGAGLYQRAQGALRYNLNPLFRLQEMTESELIAQGLAGGKTANFIGTPMLMRIFGGGKGKEAAERIDKSVRILTGKNIFTEAGAGGSGAAQDTYGALSARLTQSQKRSVAGLAEVMAKKAGYDDLGKFIDEADPVVIDNLRKVVQYPQKGFVSSNFAKTLNVLVFPSRYQIKLAGIIGETLAKQPAVIQIATLKGAADFSSFLNSEEGIKWQAENSELIGMMNYFNPLTTLDGVMRALQGKDVKVTDFGMIGGLPFGVFSQLFETTTGKDLDRQFVDPKTGEPVVSKMPADMSGALKMGITDIINSVYSFPGKTFGTSLSKKQLVQGFLPVLKPEKGETKDAPTQELTEEQKRTRRILSGNTSKINSSRQTKLPATITKGTIPTLKKQVITPIYKTPKGGTGRKGPRPKTYAKRRGQDGF